MKHHRSVEPIYDGYSNSIENTGNYEKSELRTQSYPRPQDLHRAKNPWLQAFPGEKPSGQNREKKTHIGHATLYYNITHRHCVLPKPRIA